MDFDCWKQAIDDAIATIEGLRREVEGGRRGDHLQYRPVS
jgi:hypothetical protein